MRKQNKAKTETKPKTASSSAPVSSRPPPPAAAPKAAAPSTPVSSRPPPPAWAVRLFSFAITPKHSPSPPSSPPTPSPFYDWLRESAKLFAIGVAVTLLLMLIVAFLPPSIIPKPSWNWETQEMPLYKNSNVTLQAGDSLEYAIGSDSAIGADSSARRVVIAALPSRLCPGVVLADITSAQSQFGSLAAANAAAPGVFAICVGNDGVERATDCGSTPDAPPAACGRRLGSNLSFSNATWPYFAPWMLALSPHFSWSANLTLRAMPVNLTSAQLFSWQVINTTTYAGRPAYAVEVRSGPAGQINKLSANSNDTLLLLIDAQYRVLLFTNSSGHSIRLLRAPFSLGPAGPS